MPDNLFDNVNSETPKLDESKDYYAELVGPEAKFKTNQDLAKGKAYSDALISVYERKMDQLAAENARLMDESRAGPKLEELINQIASRQPLASSELPPAKEDNKPSFDPNQLDSLISDKMYAIERARTEAANFKTVKDQLQERLGNNYPTVLKQIVETLGGLTMEDANALAKKSPAAFMRTLGLDKPAQTENFQSPPQTRQNSNFAPAGGPKRTWTYYQELRKKNPKLYNDTKINIQMQKDIIELGDAFKDGDFKSFGD